MPKDRILSIRRSHNKINQSFVCFCCLYRVSVFVWIGLDGPARICGLLAIDDLSRSSSSLLRLCSLSDVFYNTYPHVPSIDRSTENVGGRRCWLIVLEVVGVHPLNILWACGFSSFVAWLIPKHSQLPFAHCCWRCDRLLIGSKWETTTISLELQ